MREIKFRAWDKKEKVMRLSPSETWALGNWFDAHCNCSDKDRAIFMQYTGLKDITGRKIYEGDIVEGDKLRLFEVRWFGGYFAIVSPKCCKRCADGTGNHGGLYEATVMHKIEVIGNIYETPELLKEK